ncbi:YbaN family protein [Haliangium sp.]|uniref:YbaN family protein n=1 Tax=Haliangium sp. TaxID=2663208 RepID=UPI003D0CD16A
MATKLDPERRPRPALAARSRGRAAKLVWLGAGSVCFAVGVIGVALPGIPTTGPMLLALACFARSSERLHDWLLHHRVFGPPLHRWREHRVIPVRAKVVAIAMMSGSFVYVVWFSPLPRWAVIATGVFIVIGAAVVLRIPHRVAEPSGVRSADLADEVRD